MQRANNVGLYDISKPTDLSYSRDSCVVIATQRGVLSRAHPVQSGTKKKVMGRNNLHGCMIFSLCVTRQRESKTALVPNNICAVLARVFGS